MDVFDGRHRDVGRRLCAEHVALALFDQLLCLYLAQPRCGRRNRGDHVGDALVPDPPILGDHDYRDYGGDCDCEWLIGSSLI